MKEQDQIKALAEIAGLIKDGELNPDYMWWNNYIFSEDGGMPDEIWNPLTSYDAIIPLIQKQDVTARHNIGTSYRAWNFIRTPAQLSEALLRSVGKWKD